MKPSRHLVKTRIVATVGPACENEDTLRELIVAGVDVFRLNFAHGQHEWLEQILVRIRSLSDELMTPVGVLGDLSGPKIRLGKLEGDSLDCREGMTVRFVRDAPEGPTDLTCSYDRLIDDVAAGDRILLADGTVRLRVEEEADDSVVCTVTEGGIIRSRQGVNLPGVALSTPSITEKDRDDLGWALSQRLDFIGLSFVRSAADISLLKQLIDDGQDDDDPWVPHVVAKIEKTEAIADLDNILGETDAVMVARGDLGVEADISRVPILQKDIIRRANLARVPVITATQMLDSMTHGDLPTRAEVSDVANAVMDGTDAVMLSGETAIGHDPAGCVRMMERIIDEAEPYVAPGQLECYSLEHRQANPITEAVSRGATVVADSLNADLIVIATNTGRTALSLSRLRGKVPIIAVTHRADTAGRISLLWGVTAVRSQLVRQSADALLQFVVQWGLDHNLLKSGQKIVIVGHTNWLGQGHDMLMVHEVPSV